MLFRSDLALELVEKNGGNHDKALDLISGMMTTGLNFAQTKNKKNLYHASDAFLCIYMYICERSENTHVGANCN